MAQPRLHQCPECHERLEEGFLGYSPGLLRHESRLRGWRRAFPCAIASGRFVLGNWASAGFFTSTPASKCPACGTVVIPGGRERPPGAVPAADQLV